MHVTNATIRAVNGLTARWASDVTASTVFSAAGLWPLLAFLADGAGGAARAELEEAVGVPADQAGGAARELLAVLESVPGLDCALGLWTKRTLELRQEWAAGLPAGAHGVLTGDAEADRGALDAWAVQRTGGVVERMPVALTEDTGMVLASALVLRTEWEEPFEGCFGRWRGAWDRAGLNRTTSDLDAVAVVRAPAGRVTRVTVRGDTGVDVHLLLGDERMAAPQVIAAGLDELADALPCVPGNRFGEGETGPGLHVAKVRTPEPAAPELELTTVEFTLTGEHDLLHDPAIFGLEAASDTSSSHFPGISATPLAVDSAEQSVTATFSAEGFRAAAVTAMGIMFMGAHAGDLPYEQTSVKAFFDRPFGFLAVHRETRLVLAAGWVTDPKPYREDDYN